MSDRSRWFQLASILAASAALAQGGAGARYRTVNTTEFGRAVVGQRGDAKTVKAALQLTLRDMAQYFGVSPSVRGAYEDSRDPHAGGATFVLTSAGVPVKGLLTCRVGAQGASVAVIYIRADAPAGEWARLTQSPDPTGTAAAVAPSGAKGVAVAKLPLKTYSFPDGTGTIGLADGWHTDAQTAMHGVIAQGPRDAAVAIGVALTVLTPNSPFARGGTSLVSPFGSPADVLRTLGPQLSQMSVRTGGPARQLDDIKVIETHKPNVPGGSEALLGYGVTEQTRSEGPRHFRAMALVALNPINNTSYIAWVTQARAPDATYERDLPVMLEIINSVRTNDAAVRQKNGQALAAQKQWFNAQQQAHQQQVAAFDAHNKQWWDSQKANEQRNHDWEQQQNAKARKDDDFDELIRGYRTVEDSRTGVKTSVDLGNVDKIVDDLNEHDPGRYRSIPLRDEADPLLGR